MRCETPGCTHICCGCCVPKALRVNLPVDWTQGMKVPGNLTIHTDYDMGRRFAFRGEPYRQDRVDHDVIFP